MLKHGLSLMRIFPSRVLSLYGKIRIQFCLFTENTDQKIPNFGISYAVIRKKWQSLIRLTSRFTAWKVSKYGVFLVHIQSKYRKIRTRKTPYLDTFHGVILKLSFFQRLFMMRPLVNETIKEKKLSKLLPPKNFFFSVTMFWKTAGNKDFAKLKGKNLIRIKSCNPSQDFQQFSEKFYNSDF